MSQQSPNPVLLVVEDNPTDILLLQEALKRIGRKVELRVVHDGIEALNFLRRRGGFASAPTPNLILLDLNTPRKGGLEVMADLKSDPYLRVIPLIVFTSSKSPDDISQSYYNYASCYVVKPLDFTAFRRSLELILDLWLNVATLPPTPDIQPAAPGTF